MSAPHVPSCYMSNVPHVILCLGLTFVALQCQCRPTSGPILPILLYTLLNYVLYALFSSEISTDL